MEISVVIPLYNKQNTIKGAIDSVLAQTYQPNEIIVVNDGSTDDSEREVIAINDSKIRLVNQNNAGVSIARNTGVKEAKCNWIAFLDADDQWAPSYLETIRELHVHFPEATVLGTAYILQNYSGEQKKITLNKLPFSGKKGLLTNYFKVGACSEAPLWSSAIVVAKDRLLDIGGFPEGVTSGEDLITWARLAIKNKIAYSTEAHSFFIQDAAHTYDALPNRVPQDPDVVGSSLAQLWQDNKSIKGLRSYLAHWYKMRASIYLRLGMNGKALKEIGNSLYYKPNNFRLYAYLVMMLLPINHRIRAFKKLGNG